MGRNSATAAVALLLNLTLGLGSIRVLKHHHRSHSRQTLSGYTMQYQAVVDAGQYVCGLWYQGFAQSGNWNVCTAFQLHLHS